MSVTQIEIFSSKEELEKRAAEIADKSPENYQQCTYLYFIARYFVVLYETRFTAIPLQVWNEYRNALDHYFRHITSADENQHIIKMAGHIQRAVLDITKIYCHDSHEEFKKDLSKENDACLRLVDNGSFHTELIRAHQHAVDVFQKAKINDSALGEDASTDREVLSNYLDACYAFLACEELLSSKREAIDKITAEASNMTNKAVVNANKHAFNAHVLASLVAKAIALVLAVTFGMFIKPYATDWYNSYANDDEITSESKAAKNSELVLKRKNEKNSTDNKPDKKEPLKKPLTTDPQ